MVNREPRLEIDPRSVARCVAALDRLADFSVPAGSLEVAFVDPVECASLHAAFFDDPGVTDVMTFPGDPEDRHAGDIAICPQVAMAQGAEAGLDFARELSLYLLHAWLHLAGLDDRDPDAVARMRAAETRLMRHLEAEGALLGATWIPGG
jgi:probable rRNA maturation factor